MNITPVCAPKHMPGKDRRRMVDEKTGRVFYRRYCAHCGIPLGDDLTEEVDQTHELLHAIMGKIRK